MSEIKVTSQPSDAELQNLGVPGWATWSKEASKFPWEYSDQETCYFLEGEVLVTPAGGEPVKMGKGDLVTFPKGMECTWEILKDVKKHYRFE
ncbi:cupin domain-containing protein [Planctomycetota bacterium]